MTQSKGLLDSSRRRVEALKASLTEDMYVAGRLGDVYAMNNLRCAIDCTEKIGLRLTEIEAHCESFR